MTTDPADILDKSKVKLLGIGSNQIVLDHVPGWYGEACCQGLIRKIKIQGVTEYEGFCLRVETPTKVELAKVGDVIKTSLNGALFVRHFSSNQ